MSEDFLSRWSRRKRESAREPAQQNAAATPDSESAPAEAAAATEIDPANLPAIESIDAGSNVSVFMRPGVPDDLTRAALRTAWVSDPAIRDFIGIAENQWDFNSEGAIAGFGSLSAEEYARHLAARALSARSLSTRALSGADTPAAPAVSNDDRREPGDARPLSDSADNSRAPTALASSPPSEPTAVPTAEPTEPESRELPETPASGRTHGSALPR